MRRWLLALAWSGVPVGVVAAGLGFEVWSTNHQADGVRGLGTIVACFFALLLVPLGGLSMTTAALFRAVGKQPPLALAPSLTVAALFVWAWFARFEPAHQPWTAQPHLSCAGAAGLALLVLAFGLIVAPAFMRERAFLVPATMSAGVALVLSLLASALVSLHEPNRDRTAAARSVAVSARRGQIEQPKPFGPHRRVLVVAFDGLDLRLLDVFFRVGVALPTFRRMFGEGQFWQSENLGMPWSPQIWASIYTGVLPDEHGVHGFSSWRFPGMTKAIRRLPNFGAHSLFFLGRVLPAMAGRGIGDEVESRTRDLERTPIWRAASANGLRVGVFDPVPFVSDPEVLRGFFTARRGGEYWTVFGDGTQIQAIERVEAQPLSLDYGALSDSERERRQLAVRLFGGNKVDLGIYYSHFIDQAMHATWAEPLRGKFFACSPLGQAGLANGPFAKAYVEADTTLRELESAFGDRAIVIVISDHGWEWNEYLHYTAPRGVQLIWGYGGEPGYLGTQSVLAIGATVLSLTGSSEWTAAQGKFIDLATPGTQVDLEKRKQLRALGYLGGN